MARDPQVIAADYEDALNAGDFVEAERINKDAYDDDEAQELMKSIDRKHKVGRDEPLMKRTPQGHH